MDFYTIDVLSDAKVRLIDDINTLNLSNKPPHIPLRRNAEGRLAHEVDDIMTLFTFIDEMKLLDLLPQYVSSSPDKMPSLRLYEGDLQVLMAVVKELIGKVDGFGASLAAIASDVKALQVWPPLPVPLSTETTEPRQTEPQQRYDTVAKSVATSRSNKDTMSTRMDWANMVAEAASSPISRRHQSSTIEATDDERDAQPFTEVQSRRSVKRRRRQTAQQVQQTDEQQSARDSRRRGKQLLRGNSATGVRGLSAAKQIPEKAVFLVDNVDLRYNADDMRSFVSNMSVTVLSCFRVKPRRRRGESSPIKDRGAFRLCIDAADREQLLVGSNWPDSVTISEWYFIDPSDARRRRDAERLDRTTSDTATGRLSPIATPASVLVAGAAAGATSLPTTVQPTPDDDDDNVTVRSEDNESTVLYIDASSTAVA